MLGEEGGAAICLLSRAPFFPWLPCLLTGCLTDIFSPFLRGTQEVPTKEPSPEGTPSPPCREHLPRPAGGCRLALDSLDNQLCGPRAGALFMGTWCGWWLRRQEESRQKGCLLSCELTLSTGSHCCHDGRLGAEGFHESIIVGIEKEPQPSCADGGCCHAQALQILSRKLDSRGPGWDQVLPGSVMRTQHFREE